MRMGQTTQIKKLSCLVISLAALLLAPRAAQAKVIVVRTATDLSIAAMDARAGDVIEIMAGPIYNGGLVFTHNGTKERPIVVRGVKVDGKRPVISGADRVSNCARSTSSSGDGRSGWPPKKLRKPSDVGSSTA